MTSILTPMVAQATGTPSPPPDVGGMLLRGLIQQLPHILIQMWPLFAILLAFVIFKKVALRAVAGWLYRGHSGIDSIRKLNWQQFELFMGEFFRRRGFQVSQTGLAGADGGIDLVLHRGAERAVVQCKQWRVYRVGPSPIRDLYGAMTAAKADRGIFVTSGTFTAAARSFAAGKPLELIDGEQLAAFYQAEHSQQQGPSAIQTASPSPAPAAEPACPKCGGPMALRTAKHGVNAGNRFWGCQRYPSCRGIVNLA